MPTNLKSKKNTVPTPDNEQNDLWDLGSIEKDQEFKSHKTSINMSKLPATFSKLERMNAVEPGMLIADIGGGRYDNAVEWAKTQGAKLFVYDPFNRTIEHNRKVVGRIADGKADIATCNNVLNVIKEKMVRQRVIRQVENVLKIGGVAYFLIYEGSKTGMGGATQGNLSWQNNLKVHGYVDEVAEIFGYAIVKNGMIVATKTTNQISTSRLKDLSGI